MFDASSRPRVFGVPPGADFPAALVAGLVARSAGAPVEALARTRLIVNTQRMERRLTGILVDGPARLLPQITPIARLADAFPCPGLPAPRSPLRRKIELSRLIGALIDAEPDLAPRQSVFALADSLAALFDEMAGEGVAPTMLTDLDIDQMSRHWDRSLTFIKIAEAYGLALDAGAADAESRQRMVVEALVSRWRAGPPSTPVIVAGSTGSRATTAHLMAAVARLPQGALVLPGFDFDLPSDAWARIGREAEDHPQARFALLFDQLGLEPSDVAQWHEFPVPTTRNRLISLSLRPAPVTDQWLRDGPGLGDLPDATADMSLIEAPSTRIEAQAIALCLREAAEHGTPAALVSPDRMLTRQVTAALSRWGVEPDDSAGRPLALSAPGRLLRHVADAMGERLTALALIVLLKHPLTQTGGTDRGSHLRRTRELELHLRKKAIAFPEAAQLIDWAEGRQDDSDAWVAWIIDTLGALVGIESQSLTELVATHRAVTERLAKGHSPIGESELWREPAGEAALAAMNELAEASEAGAELSPFDYRALVSSALNTGEVRDPVQPHPGVMIWGTLEARVQGADLVILGGMNDGTWPEMPEPDPWLNRALRRQAGLLLPDRRIGLSAHDYQQAIAAPRVVITRSKRDAEAETVPSRWLNRLINLLDGLPEQGGKAALAAMRGRGRLLLDHARSIDRQAPEVAQAHRPSPRPPAIHRPRRMSVTDIERLIRDPYAIYARHVLGLRRLDSLDRRPDAALRGNAFHKVMERFVADGIDPAASDARLRLMVISDNVLAEMVPWPATRRLWQARLADIADRILADESMRRTEGTPCRPERWGEMPFPDLGFELVGKADRIDRLHDGRLAIYDYKTGTVPTTDQVRHFNKQLLLEAIMAEAGAFTDIPAAEVAKVAYIALSASNDDRDIPLTVTKEDDFTTITTAVEFRRLVAAYQRDDQGYTARRAVTETRFDGDYDHLARFGEWDDSDGPVAEDLS